MGKEKYPVTPAVRFLKANNVQFETFEYVYEEKGGTKQSALELNVDENLVIKTLIFSADGMTICVLMHGDMEVSTKELARQLNVKVIVPSEEKTAFNNTGYKFGGTSPFGTRKMLPIYIESSILSNEMVYINGGKQGFLLGINPEVIKTLLGAEEVNVGIKK